jgi:hypothetical protein
MMFDQPASTSPSSATPSDRVSLRSRSWRAAGAALLIAAVSLPQLACLRPTLTITSEPSGAAVVVNGDYHGTTPVEVPFIWYWYYEVELRQDGYEGLKVRERMQTPVWALIPLDFFIELMPFNVYDRHYRHYFMEPERLSAGRRPLDASQEGSLQMGDFAPKSAGDGR